MARYGVDALGPLVKGNKVASQKTRRVIAIGAFAVAAAAGPVIAATMTSTAAPQDYQAAPGQCLAWFGNQEDGKCLGYSNGQPINGGTPWWHLRTEQRYQHRPSAARHHDQPGHRLALFRRRRRLRLEHRCFGVDRRQRDHLRIG